jgi:hypothetical protein
MAKTNNVNKVSPTDKDKKNAGTEADPKAKKPKVEKIDFPKKDAQYRNPDGQVVTAVNEEGLLIAVPVTIKDGETVVYSGYDVRKHKPLKKTDFASSANFLQFQAHSIRLKAERMLAVAKDKETKAERLLKFGDEQTRKKAAKVAKMREQLAALEKQLSEEGIDVQEL